jgi:hypothetical protein
MSRPISQTLKFAIPEQRGAAGHSNIGPPAQRTGSRAGPCRPADGKYRTMDAGILCCRTVAPKQTKSLPRTIGVPTWWTRRKLRQPTPPLRKTIHLLAPTSETRDPSLRRGRFQAAQTPRCLRTTCKSIESPLREVSNAASPKPADGSRPRVYVACHRVLSGHTQVGPRTR